MKMPDLVPRALRHLGPDFCFRGQEGAASRQLQAVESQACSIA